MKQQILIINGGNTFENHGAYLKSLKEFEPNLDRMRYKGSWKNKLQRKLGWDYDVLIPQMPNTSNARYKDWSIILDKIAPLLNDDVILIGHSLGGIFLAGYLSENTFPKKIKAIILIAPPFDDETSESLADFKLIFPLDRFASSSKKILIFHSKDDPVIPFSEHTKYIKALPNAQGVFFEDRQHFNQESFPELVEIIKAL